ncbi:ABZ1 [[Candida] subhashii]|uniref:aminodeoxychorismate synthase n=1 Tax=[Candida] subhashii TaxID=561895 RepID=A0A8J5UFE0_9ASCO|nr:ABZ1 [[Candida] subhashii]KAG7661953.1 ABZ1 [[Candida] subhashii]
MILLIDSYDSFTNNLAHLLKQNANQEVTTIHNDSFTPSEYEYFYNHFLPQFDYVVIGPGPGHPSIAEDVGIISWLIKRLKAEEYPIPILGICLGFQSLCYEFGNEVMELDNVRHGQIYKIHPMGDDKLFAGLDGFGSVRYHSLCVEDLNDEIIPLAYCYESQDDGSDRKILMAMKHRVFPFYGVQYHPESICSDKGNELIKRFTKLAKEYNEHFRTESLVNMNGNSPSVSLNGHAVHEDYLLAGGKLISNQLDHIYFKKFTLPHDITPVDVCDHFHKLDEGESNFILLNSASFPGEWSIIGLPIENQSEIITHSVDDLHRVYLSTYKSTTRSEIVDLEEHETAWNVLARRIQEKYVSRDVIKSKISEYPTSRELPFFGGYLGIVSYEEGQHIVIDKLESICGSKSTPDLKVIYIERMIVYDHVTKDWFVISINSKDDSEWGNTLVDNLLDSNLKINLDDVATSVKYLAKEEDSDVIKFELPSQEIYEQQFNKCQDYLHSGNSYELCLTTQSKIHLPSYINPWDIYKVLTLHKNPSPFSCFMEFDDCCLISSSPERFLSWKDNTNEPDTKLVELRPIKGTVKNTDDVNLEIATKILKTPKEMGENLMIVDLIRHDLYQFTDHVCVSQLMKVEEYKTVFQLVSVIQGKLASRGYHGIDILRSSLPPGSMTGAPKKRSVELLQDIESMQEAVSGGRRGIYSGVVGYWSITDDSDWSVIIRSVFHYANDVENTSEVNLWRIGAGGAITVLSELEGEWDEMLLKLQSALQAFK